MRGMVALRRAGSRLTVAVVLAAAMALSLVAALIVASPARAEIGSVFGGDIACTVQGDGVRFCGSDAPRSTTKTFDGVPIDVNVAFPPAPATGADNDYPLVMLFHGYGGEKFGLAAMRPWLERGYAVFTMTARGFHESCGSPASRTADSQGCAEGYVRLMDTRYEVRDAQHLAGRLVDDGLVDPNRIGAVGGSYGGGMSMALAALRNRIMRPDGSLARWRSPGGTPMRLAAAAPSVPWTDLAYALVPNGSTLDYVADSPYRGRFGVMKESYVNGLYLSGLLAPGFYAPVGTPGADLTGWKARLDAGEPYDGDPEATALIDEITAHHSSYYIDPDVRPAPLLISSGFTDDLFPVDEALRFYNRTRERYPKAPISLFFGDFGHMRAQNKDDVESRQRERELAWIDHFVAGEGERPFIGVEAMTQTCPDSAPSGGPFRARRWPDLSKGEIRARFRAQQTIAADAGDSAIARTFDPITGGGACATAPGADQPGVATYRLDPAPPAGYTLLGSPTVIADFTLRGETSQVAARLLDVAPDGTETLVARGLWRPQNGGPERQVFQLHPNGWRFDGGHVPKLELLPADAGGAPLNSYGRPSNGQEDVTVSRLELRLPVRERPGALRGLVHAPLPPRVPDGLKLARDFRERGNPRARLAKGKLKAKGNRVRMRIRCPRRFEVCRAVEVRIKARRGPLVAKRTVRRLRRGQHKAIGAPLRPRARRLLRRRGSLKVTVTVRSAETKGAFRARKRLAR